MISGVGLGLSVALALLALGGCSKTPAEGDPRICRNLAISVPPGMPLDGNEMQAVTACVERWSARLSAAPDPAAVVAAGVIGGCSKLIAEYEAIQARDEGRPMNTPAAEGYWKGQALFTIVEWRAGKCKIPE